jgi:hypothetical protein
MTEYILAVFAGWGITALAIWAARRGVLSIDDELCPEHGDTLTYHTDQGDEYEMREHLICAEWGCGYEIWAS